MISTHSLNLLPPENRARIGYLRLGRFFVLVHSYFAFLLLIGITLLLPTYFFLYFQNKSVSDLAEATREKTNQTEAREIEARIEQANTILHRLETEYNMVTTAQNPVTTYLETIVEMAPAGIIFTRFSFEKDADHILLRGHAATRSDLLQFVETIRSNPSFHTVESPIENVLQNSDISFTLSFTATNNETKKQ